MLPVQSIIHFGIITWVQAYHYYINPLMITLNSLVKFLTNKFKYTSND